MTGRSTDFSRLLREGLLLDALRHMRHKFSAGDVILRRPFSDDDLWRALSPELWEFASTAELLVLRDQIDAATTLRLLKSGCNEMALLVAESIAQSQHGEVPKAILPDWEQVLIEFKLTGNYSADEHLVETLKQHPSTIMQIRSIGLAIRPIRLPLSQIAPLAAIKYAYFAGKCTFIYADSITDRRCLVKGNFIQKNYLPNVLSFC